MFKLKLKYPFCGHGTAVFCVTVFAALFFVIISIIICTALDTNHPTDGIIPSIIIAVIIVPVISFFWLHRILPCERDYMEDAEFPLWRPIEEWEKQIVAEQKKFQLISYIILMVFEVVFCYSLSDESNNTFLNKYIYIFVFGVTLLIGLFDFYRSGLWKNLDDTALCAEIPVRECYNVKAYQRRSYRFDKYMKIFLPDGKYCLRQRDSLNYRSVKVIKFNGMLTYIEGEIE